MIDARMPAGSVFLLAIALLIGGGAVAPAQTTQPAGEIRRSAAAVSASNASGPSATRVALSLAAVLGLIVILFLAGRRFLPRGSLGQQARSGAVQVLARTAISPKQRIVLLQVGRRILVIADGAGSGGTLSTLCEITDADEAAALIGQLQADRGHSSFSSALSSAMERFRSAEHQPSPPSPPSPRESQRSIDAMREEIEGLAKRVRGMAR
jgi:flagellar protein FliO/FliZ